MALAGGLRFYQRAPMPTGGRQPCVMVHALDSEVAGEHGFFSVEEVFRLENFIRFRIAKSNAEERRVMYRVMRSPDSLCTQRPTFDRLCSHRSPLKLNSWPGK